MLERMLEKSQKCIMCIRIARNFCHCQFHDVYYSDVRKETDIHCNIIAAKFSYGSDKIRFCDIKEAHIQKRRYC